MKTIITVLLAFGVVPVWIITLLSLAVRCGGEDLIVGACMTGAMLCIWIGRKGVTV